MHETGNLWLLSRMDKDLICFQLSYGKGMSVSDDSYSISTHLSAINWQS